MDPKKFPIMSEPGYNPKELDETGLPKQENRGRGWAGDMILPVHPNKFKWSIYSERGTPLSEAARWMKWKQETIYDIGIKKRIHIRAMFDVLEWKNYMRRKYNQEELTIDEYYEIIKPDDVPSLFDFDFAHRKDYERAIRKKARDEKAKERLAREEREEDLEGDRPGYGSILPGDEGE